MCFLLSALQFNFSFFQGDYFSILSILYSLQLIVVQRKEIIAVYGALLSYQPSE